MTQASTDFTSAIGVSTTVPVPVRRRRAVRQSRYLAAELVATLWGPLRLLIRHWPVLFVLGVAAAGAREGFIRLAVRLAGVDDMLGLLVWLLAPLSVMVALVLMLNVVRPSLPSARGLDRAASPWRDMGSVLIPFVAFYLAFDLFQEDYRDYNSGLSATYESLGAYLDNPHQPDVRVADVTEGWRQAMPLLIVVVIAFALRWGLNKWELARRQPILGITGAYLESIWVILGGLLVIKQWVDSGEAWAGQRKAWHAVLDWWHGLVSVNTGGLGRLYHTVDDWLVAAIPSGNFNRIFVVPITGLVAAAVVYNLRVSDELRPPRTRGPHWLRWLTRGLVIGASRRFGPLIAGVRAMALGGALPIMFFCLAAVALQTATQWLRLAAWALIGPRPTFSIQSGLWPSVEGLIFVVTLVLLVCVLAAAADGIARRTGRPGTGAPARGSADSQPDVDGNADVVVDTQGPGLYAGR